MENVQGFGFGNSYGNVNAMRTEMGMTILLIDSGRHGAHDLVFISWLAWTGLMDYLR